MRVFGRNRLYRSIRDTSAACRRELLNAYRSGGGVHIAELLIRRGGVAIQIEAVPIPIRVLIGGVLERALRKSPDGAFAATACASRSRCPVPCRGKSARRSSSSRASRPASRIPAAPAVRQSSLLDSAPLAQQRGGIELALARIVEQPVFHAVGSVAGASTALFTAASLARVRKCLSSLRTVGGDHHVPGVQMGLRNSAGAPAITASKSSGYFCASIRPCRAAGGAAVPIGQLRSLCHRTR